MSQQEMNYKGVKREERADFFQHSTATSGQKVHPHNLSREDALKARLLIAYISLALVMAATFMIYVSGAFFNVGDSSPGDPQLSANIQSLPTVYLVIIGINVAINIFIAKRYKK